MRSHFGEWFGEKIGPWEGCIDFVNCHFTAGDVIAKAVTFDRNVLCSGAVLAVLVCNLQGASGVLVDNAGLVLLAKHRCCLVHAGFGEGGVCCRQVIF